MGTSKLRLDAVRAPSARVPSSRAELDSLDDEEQELTHVGKTASLMAIDRIVSMADLDVVFQPIVRLETDEVFAYEALARCKIPALANPAKLFERAIQDRCVGRLGKMLREIALPLCEGVPIFFNLHPVELDDRWLVRPDDAIYRHDAPVYLEITESVPIDHVELCTSVLKEIRERAGARLVVDDLGAGYSNLKYIVDLEPAVVKLDRELLQGIAKQPRVRQLVRSLVRLCDDLGAEVVAEGVETADELSAVRDQGVQLVQGYFLARPGYPLPLSEKLAQPKPRARKR